MNNTVFEMCIVQDVDTKNMLVSAYFLASRKMVYGIVYSYPFAGPNMGTYYVPKKGSIGIVTLVNNVPIIIGFTGSMHNTGKDTVTRSNSGVPEMGEGTIMLTTSPNSWLEFDAEGEISVHVPGVDVVLTKTGEIKVNSVKPVTKNIGDLCFTEGVHKIKTGTDNKTEVELIYSIVNSGKLTFGIDIAGREYHGSREV